MKMTKVLFGAAVLAMVFGFASCKNEDDDPEGAISWNLLHTKATVEYDNVNGYTQDSGTDAKSGNSGVYRAFKRTTNKHISALMAMTFNESKNAKGTYTAGKDAGVLGFVWDLKSKTSTDTDDSATESFFIVGVRNNNGTLQYYVSKYFNISNKQALNFGVATANSKTDYSALSTDVTTGTTAGEWDITNGFKNITGATITDTATVWVDVYPKYAGNTKYGQAQSRATDAYSAADDGSFLVSIYVADPEKNESATPVETITIPATVTGYAGEPDQTKNAAYVNVYSGKAVSGVLEFADTYAEAEPIEEDAE